ncbi:MAG: xanthine dehydrogenase family protein molybdopterin-binding subunit, partial [Defluviitaleaceae bacterium]|nr:xanthine dehydrogenase family protein molybdopterin-binding subunit [Defluviitaleaceae bacterium]
NYVGKRAPYLDARLKATGEAKYTYDIQRQGALFGKALACPYVHARIRSMDISEAKKLPGVYAVITADNVPEIKYNPAGLEYAARDAEAAAFDNVNDMTPVTNVSHYKGEIIAAVAAKNEETAIKALELIKIDYEVLPFVIDVIEAMNDGAPIVQEGTDSNVSVIYEAFPGNRGDADAALAESDVIVECDFLPSRQHTMALEPLSCTAEFDAEGNLTVWLAHQRPFILRRQIARLAGLPESKVNIISEYAGGFFGESNFVIVPLTVLLAKQAGKPVRLEFSREELALHVPCREMFHLHGKLGFTKEGRLLVSTEDIVADSGSYFNRSANLMPPAMGAYSSQFDLPVFRGVAKIVYTNTPGTSGIRGYGSPTVITLLSHLMDLAAEKLSVDRVELRLKNYKMGNHAEESEARTPATMGIGLETQDSVMRVAAEKFNWSEKSLRPKEDGKWRRGIGVCDYMDVSGPQPHEMNDRQCVMTLEEDGTVTVTLNCPDGGQNMFGAAAQIGAETSGLRYEDFRFLHSQTGGALYDIGLGGNSGNFGFGNLLAVAGRMLKERILEKASKFMGAPPEALDVKDGIIFEKGNPSHSMPAGKLAYSSIVVQEGASEHISITARYSAEVSPMSVGVVMADVKVDTETGDIFVEKLQICHDCGIAINPMCVEGQLQGGSVMGYGHAMYEDLSIGADGELRGNNFNAYKISSALDIPDLDVIVFENPCPFGPFGAKGVGQSGAIGISGAISSAIYDATGIWLEKMPFSPEAMLAGLKAKHV